jgi:predicted dehydrogenase
MPSSCPQEPLGVAVVGVGSAGRQHMEAIRATPGLGIVAVVDADPAAAARAAAEGLPVHTLEDAVADDAVRLVAVCTPPGDRAAVVAAVLGAGRHLLVEKPPARGPAELEWILRAAEAARTGAAVMFQHRFVLPPALHEGAPERFAGAVGTLLVSRPRSRDHYDSAGWRSTVDRALGGVTAHLGVHYVDLACQLLGVPVAIRPMARTDAAPGIDVRLCGHVSFTSGAELAVIVTSRASARHEHLTVLGAADRVELRGGVLEAEVDGRALAVPSRPAATLRAEVYGRVGESVRSGAPLGLAALHRSRGVVDVLDGLLAPATAVASR